MVLSADIADRITAAIKPDRMEECSDLMWQIAL